MCVLLLAMVLDSGPEACGWLVLGGEQGVHAEEVQEALKRHWSSSEDTAQLSLTSFCDKASTVS